MGKSVHDDATRAKIADLWIDHPELSVLDIAKRLRMTKSQVLGIAHRMPLPSRVSPIHKREDGEAPTVWQKRDVPTLSELVPLASLGERSGLSDYFGAADDTAMVPDNPGPQRPP